MKPTPYIMCDKLKTGRKGSKEKRIHLGICQTRCRLYAECKARYQVEMDLVKSGEQWDFSEGKGVNAA